MLWPRNDEVFAVDASASPVDSIISLHANFTLAHTYSFKQQPFPDRRLLITIHQQHDAQLAQSYFPAQYELILNGSDCIQRRL